MNQELVCSSQMRQDYERYLFLCLLSLCCLTFVANRPGNNECSAVLKASSSANMCCGWDWSKRLCKQNMKSANVGGYSCISALAFRRWEDSMHRSVQYIYNFPCSGSSSAICHYFWDAQDSPVARKCFSLLRNHDKAIPCLFLRPVGIALEISCSVEASLRHRSCRQWIWALTKPLQMQEDLEVP